MSRPQRFEIHQEITVKTNQRWWKMSNVPGEFVCPKEGEIYHVRAYRKSKFDFCWTISLMELNPFHYYAETGFDPVGTLDETSAILEESRFPQEVQALSLVEQHAKRHPR